MSAMLPEPPMPSRIARFFANQAGLYCLSALVAAMLGIAALTAVAMSDMTNANPGEPVDPRVLWHSMTVGRQLIAVFGLVFALWMPILLAARATCRITAAQFANQNVAFTAVLTDMLRFLPSALVYSLVIGFPIMLGGIFLLVPGIILASLFTLVVPAGVNEPVGTFGAVRRGVSLSGKVFGKSLLIVVLSFAAIVLVVVLRIAGIDRFLPASGSMQFGLRFLVTYLPALLLLVLTNIGFTLLYHAARRAENPMAHSAFTTVSESPT
jgi:hypothetical protein